jgi:16S rRNA (uracil1498-N3)-methyltransferase
MMGVGAIEPIVTERTMVRLKALADGRAVERWRRIAIASAKQCRRAVVPLVGPGIELSECLVRDAVELRMMLVEPAAARAGHPLSTLGADRPSSATLLVGPEGGWSADEIDAAVSAGWIPITAGRRTFRAEAAAPIAMAVLQFLWGDL